MPKYDANGALLRDLRRNKHYTIDNEFLDEGYGAAVGKDGIAAYNVICRFANITTSTAFPAYPTIARLGSMSESQAKRAVKKLRALNIISYVPRRGRGHSNEYCLIDSSEWTDLKGVTQTPFKKSSKSTTKSTEKVSHRHYLKGVCVTPEQTNIFDQSESSLLSSVSSPRQKDSQPIYDHAQEPEILPGSDSEKTQQQQQLSSISDFKKRKARKVWTKAEKEEHLRNIELQKQKILEESA
jgi:hypothetical protein